MNYSTPAKYRNSKEGVKNHLKVVMNLVRAGLTRAAGANLVDTAPNDPAIRDLFRGLIIGANEPWTENLLMDLVGKDKQEVLLSKSLTEVFKKIDQASETEIATMKKIGLYS